MPTEKGRQAKRPKATAFAHDGSTIIVALRCAQNTNDYARQFSEELDCKQTYRE